MTALPRLACTLLPAVPAIVLTVALVVPGTALGAAAQTLTSAIDRVTVYRTGAMIERTVRLSLDAGDNPLSITGLPAGLDLALVELSSEEGGVRLGQLGRSADERVAAVSAEVRELTKALEQTVADERAIADSVRTANLKLKFLEGLAGGYAKATWSELAAGGGSIDAWAKALATLDTGSSEALAQIRSSEGETQRLAARRSQLERQLKQARGRDTATTTLTLNAASAKAQPITLRLRYPQRQAGWTSTYEARMNSATGRLELLQQASVQQATAEDWEAVALTLSTGNPSAQIAPPTLQPQFLNLYDPAQSKRGAMERVQSAAPAADIAQFARAESGVIAEPAAAPQVTQYGVSYPVPGRVTVANDADDEQRFDLERLEFAAELVTRVVPARAPAGFLLAKFTYDQQATLAASRLRAYLDGNYIGESRLPRARQGQALELSLGQNRGLEVLVEDQGGEDGESGIISKRREESVDFLYRLVNRGSKAIAVEVLDQLPVSRNEAVTVTVPRSATQPTDRDLANQPGILRWAKSLVPGADWSIKHQYQISYPADQRLSRR